MSLQETSNNVFPINLYEKFSELGSGGQGEVWEYRLMDPSNEGYETPFAVAVKRFKRNKKQPEVYNRSQGHGHAILKDLRHKNLIRVFDVYEDEEDKHTCVVMELAQGSLEDLLEDRSLSLAEAAFVILQILIGLTYLHFKGIMHRDLKPQNILIKSKSSNWREESVYDLVLCIADYDFARRFTVTDPTQSTTSMSILGTYVYVAPEIREVWGKEESAKYSESADIFSLGVMSYQIVRGLQVKIPIQIDKLMDLIMADEEISETVFLDFLLLQLNKDKKERANPSVLLKHEFVSSTGGNHEAMQALREEAAIIHSQFTLPMMELEIEQMRHSLDESRKEKEKLEAENERLQSANEKITAEKDRLLRERNEARAEVEILREQVDYDEEEIGMAQLNARLSGMHVVENRPTLPSSVGYDRSSQATSNAPLQQVSMQDNKENALLRHQRKKLNEALWKASKDGNVANINSAVARGADINCKLSGRIGRSQFTNMTPLAVSSVQGHLKVVQCLLENGSDVSCINNHGLTPLHRAAAEGHDEVMEALIAQGAEVNRCDSLGRTPLAVASSFGKASSVMLLLRKGGDASIKDKEGRTPFDVACTQDNRNRKEIVQRALRNTPEK